jgi:ERCC4-type nuclease
VEHKTASDLISSVLDDGLLNQGARMAAEGMFNWRYLIYTMPEVRGEFVVLGGRPTKIPWRLILGVLVDLQEMGITCISIAADSEYGGTLKWIAERDHGDIRIKAHRRKTVMETDQEFFLAGIDGIDTNAKVIMEKCGTLAWALDFLTEIKPSIKVPGIGKKRIANVRALMGLGENERLAVTATIDREKENGTND